MQETLKDEKLFYELYVVRDGEEAMSFLHREGKYTEVPCPDFILLDLNLPKTDGREVSIAIKSDPVLSHIPVVVLTTSGTREDIMMAYQNHANAYITKPVGPGKFIAAVKSLEDFWFTIVKHPAKN